MCCYICILRCRQHENMNMTIVTLNLYQTVGAAVAVFLLGSYIKKHSSFLRKYCIPAPVIGGILFSLLNCILHVQGVWNYNQDTIMQEFCMTLFFTSVGYAASLSMIKKGGAMVARMALVVFVLIVLQDVVGMALATTFGLSPLLGLAAGSISLVGGHGTSGSFGPVLEQAGMLGATTVAFAAATFGLVSGSLVGAPVGSLLINRFHLRNESAVDHSEAAKEYMAAQEAEKHRPIDADRFMYGLAQLLLAMGLGTLVSRFFFSIGLVFPGYIGAMVVAAIIRNAADVAHVWPVYQRETEVLGGLCLNIFLSCALMSLKLWELADLAIPLLVILSIQVAMIACMAAIVVFRFLGKDYEAAIMVAGICGFGLGATPTAVANMDALTKRYDPAPQAFFVIPLTGALIVDFINASILMVIINMIK